MLSSRMRGAPASSASRDLVERRGTRPPAGARGRARAAARTAAPTPPAIAAWFSLIRTMSYSPKRWLRAPAGGDRRLLQRAQPRRRLAGVEDARARALHGAHVAGGERRDAATGGRRRFSAVRSPRAAPAASPSTSSTGPRSRQSPRRPEALEPHVGIERGERRLAASRPNTTPGAFCVIVAHGAVPAGHRRGARDVARRRRPRRARGRRGRSSGCTSSVTGGAGYEARGVKI